jgi:sugar phosphate isomerase/epimerase
LEIGLQLYTLREELKEDFIGTLKDVSKIGYRNVELALGNWGYTASELKEILGDLGLQLVSSHVQYQLLDNETEAQMENAKNLGISTVVFPFLDRRQLETGEGIEQRIIKLKEIGELCKANGLRLAYHNHDFELALHKGMPILDLMLSEIGSDLLEPELDLYWLKKAGLNPIEYMKKYKGRVRYVHLKDMDQDGTFAEVGHGVMNYQEIMEAAVQAGIQYAIVEQDVCKHPPLQSVSMSYKFLRKLGYVGQ